MYVSNCARNSQTPAVARGTLRQRCCSRPVPVAPVRATTSWTICVPMALHVARTPRISVSLSKPDRRASIDFMPGSDIPVIRQPFEAGDPMPFWADGATVDQHYLYDIIDDPDEAENRIGDSHESEMADLLRVALDDVEAPAEQLARLGLG